MSETNITQLNAAPGGAEVEMPEIVIDDGSRRVPINNKFGEEIGVFYFRPTDIGMIDRYNKMAEKFPEITAPLENLSITPEGTAADGATQEEEDALKEAERRLFEACDYMFGGNMSEAFFGKMHPFSPVNGAFYCETAIAAVGKYISAQLKRETKKINARVSKYTAGYAHGQRTGKHRHGNSRGGGR